MVSLSHLGFSSIYQLKTNGYINVMVVLRPIDKKAVRFAKLENKTEVLRAAASAEDWRK